MRICLVVHGFPPLERTGVENYTASLAAALARAGHAVEVFVPRVARDLPQLSMRRVVRDGYGVTWLTSNVGPRGPEEMLDPPGVAERFGAFLESERPELVHFQHVIKLGVGLVEEARRRGIPTVYTAHDYYPICHRFTLMRPDLARCETLGDPVACARCDLALAVLNRHEELGDYQIGALAEQLDADGRAELAAALSPADAARAADWQAALERRTALDGRRAEVLAQLDLVLAPTRFLAARLAEGGLAAPRVEHLPYGIETAALAALDPPRPDPGAPLRFGFLGGLSKHKGVHVLVEAFAQLGVPAELSIWGDSSDRAYVERVREAAGAAGARWCGRYAHDELPRCLEQLDVVVAPSIWVENQPIVIREAFAAGRPVITSDVGALPESVRDGVDGLLVPPGDPAALAAAMRRLATEEGLYETLRTGIGPVEDVESQARSLVALYEPLVAERAHPDDGALPPHLARTFARWRELDALPSRELFARALDGLTRLRERLPGQAEGAPPEQLLARALAHGSSVRVLLRDLQSEKVWLRQTLQSHEQTESSLSARLRWREDRIAQDERELEWLKSTLAEVEAERDWLREASRGQEEELDWLRTKREEIEEARTWLAGKVEELERDLAWHREKVPELERDLAWHREKVEELEREVAWLRASAEDKERELVRRLDRTQALESDLALRIEALAELEGEVGRRRQRVEGLEEELAWLREKVVGREQDVAWLREQLEERRAEIARTQEELAAQEQLGARLRERLSQAAEMGVVALQAQHSVLRNCIRPLLELAGEAVPERPPSEQGRDGESLESELGNTLAAIGRAVERLDARLGELRWRRAEMDDARNLAGRRLARHLVGRTGLGRRVNAWPPSDDRTGGHGTNGEGHR